MSFVIDWVYGVLGWLGMLYNFYQCSICTTWHDQFFLPISLQCSSITNIYLFFSR